VNWIHALILGIVEGVTEFLPISSTGHLILAARLLNLPSTDFSKSFAVAIQLGAILSVVVLYWRSLMTDSAVIKRVILAFAPTAVLGFLLYKIIKKFLLGNAVVVLWALFIGGLCLILFELFHREKGDAASEVSSISYSQAFMIGLFQSLAVIPGVSRAAATIIGGLILGLRRKTIVEFSFVLAVPTMAAAVALDLARSAAGFSSGQFLLLAGGFIVSFIVALAAIKALLYYIQRNNFIIFGAYRMAAALLFWFIFFKR